MQLPNKRPLDRSPSFATSAALFGIFAVLLVWQLVWRGHTPAALYWTLNAVLLLAVGLYADRLVRFWVARDGRTTTPPA